MSGAPPDGWAHRALAAGRALHRDRRGHLPHGRRELYDAALGMLLSRRDREPDMRGPDGVELADEPQIQLRQRLAYWLIRNGRTKLDHDHDRAERLVADDSQREDVIRMAVVHSRPRERAELLRGLLAKDAPHAHLLAMACLEHSTELDPSCGKSSTPGRGRSCRPANARNRTCSSPRAPSFWDSFPARRDWRTTRPRR
ncbi:hypothetical protein [Streptomyces sp. x-19]|uniref:hypothetical protein n=1 Tax=Streptomyces sp. x-19 TaxID=2789280 RepID=UPI0039807FD2